MKMILVQIQQLKSRHNNQQRHILLHRLQQKTIQMRLQKAQATYISQMQEQERLSQKIAHS